MNPEKKNPQRITQSDREFAENKLDYSGINSPVTINQIPKIEKQSQININVFGYYQKKPYPIYISSKEKYPDHMELLFIEGDEPQQHYVYIKDYNRFFSTCNKHEHLNHYCMYCLRNFYTKESLEKHLGNCIAINGVQAIELPQPCIDRNGVERIPSVYFKNHHKQLPRPFVIYADFECNTEKIDTPEPSDEKSDKKSYIEKYQRHTAISFGYKVVCHYDKKYSGDLVIYRGEDPIGEFLKCMNREVQNCQEVIISVNH